MPKKPVAKIRKVSKTDSWTPESLKKALDRKNKDLEEAYLLLHQYATGYARLHAGMRILSGEKGAYKLKNLDEAKFIAKYAMQYAKDQKGFEGL
jgi:intergrase/recombinase